MPKRTLALLLTFIFLVGAGFGFTADRFGISNVSPSPSAQSGDTPQEGAYRVTRHQYGRILAYVWVGNSMINEAMLEEGFAAQEAKRGIWTPIP